jgi:hypothetical protein
MNDSGEHWFSRGTAFEANGQLKLDIPLNADAVIAIYAKDHSPTFVSVSRDQKELGSIPLSAGTLVSGQVVDLNNKPAAGVLVQIESSDGTLRGVGISWSRVSETDADGKYSLQPAAGACRISVLPFSTINDRIGGEESIVGKTPPLIKPLTLRLSDERGTQEVNLKEAESYRISGTAKWDDGTPAKDFEIRAGAPETLVFVSTDNEGKYEIRLPQNSPAQLIGFGAYRDSERSHWYMGRGTAPLPASSGNQIVSFDELKSDIEHVDWELRLYRESPPRTAAQKEAERAFEELQQEYGAQSVAYQTAARIDQNQLDPRNAMAAKYLAFEKKYRGEKQAIKAMVHVMQGANSSLADPHLRVFKARVEMVERLIDHYLGHEDLAETFDSLGAGPEVPRADYLLKMAYGRSPHRIVQAAALLARAERAKTNLRDLEQLTEMDLQAVMIPSTIPFGTAVGTSYESDKRITDAMRGRLDALKALNPNELRKQAIGWLAIIEKEYGDLVRPHVFEHTFGQDAKALRFAIEYVNVGKPAPPLEATDFHGKPFRLSDHLGKVVVISFNQSVNNANELPHQKLVDQFPRGSIELVTIVATHSKEEFGANMEASDIHGTLIWEPLRGSYQSSWGVTGFPTTYIVDQTGKLHGVPVGTIDCAGVVKGLFLK